MARQNTITADRTVSLGELTRKFAELAECLLAIKVIGQCLEHDCADTIPDDSAKITTGLQIAQSLLIDSAMEIVAPFNVKMEG